MTTASYVAKWCRFEHVHHPWLDDIPMLHRWFWWRQCISWYQWMFYITWQEWDTQWFVYYMVVAVCPDVYHISNGNCIIFDDSFSRFWRFYTFQTFLVHLFIRPYIVLHNLCSFIFAVIISMATLFYMWLFSHMVDGWKWMPCHLCNHKHEYYVCTVRWESISLFVSMVFLS